MKKLFMTSCLCAVVASATLFASAQQNPPTRVDAEQKPVAASVLSPAAVASSEELALRQKAFDAVWRTVNEKHYDPNFGGVDWARVRAEYEPRVAETKTDAEFYRLLQAMLGELRLSHFQIVPPDAVPMTSAETVVSGGIGLDVRLIEQAAVITRVEPSSAAARAGLRPGFTIVKVDDMTIADLLQRVAARTKTQEAMKGIVPRIALARLNGAAGVPRCGS